MKKGRFAIGAIVGAVAGVIAGILTAPKSGKETRSDIKEKATELKNTAASRASDARQRGGETAAELREKAKDLKNRTERAVEGAKEGFTADKKK